MSDVARSIEGNLIGRGPSNDCDIMLGSIVERVYEEVQNIKKTEKILIKNMAGYIRNEKEILPTMKMMRLWEPLLDNLPEGLLALDASGLELRSLPVLPSTLKILNVGNNMLTSLPALPKGLEVLVCDNNCLTELPTMPRSVKVVLAHNNCLNGNVKFPLSVKHKFTEKGFLRFAQYYGNNKEAVEHYVSENPHINRLNCNCENYGSKLKSLTDEQKKEFKKFAYYYVEDHTRDQYYTCGFCMTTYEDRCEYRHCSRFNFDD